MYAWILTLFGASTRIESQIGFNTKTSQMLGRLEVGVAHTQIMRNVLALPYYDDM